MFAVEIQLHLRLIHHKGTIRAFPLNSTVEAGAQTNQEKLKQLERERERLQMLSLIAGWAMTGALAIFTPSVAVTLPSFSMVLDQLQTVSQRYNLMYQLVQKFGEEVEIEIGLKPEGLRSIDFFLRFPDKEYVLIQIRSLGSARVFFNEAKQELQFRRKGGGIKTWKPDPLSELARQEQWIRKSRPDLLGTTSRDRRRPLSKLLVLANLTVLADHSEHLYENIDNEKYLVIRKYGTANICEKDQVTDFIRAYLAQRRSRKL